MNLVHQKELISNKQERVRIGKLWREEFAPRYNQHLLIKKNFHCNPPFNESKFIEEIVEKNRVNPLDILTPQHKKSISKQVSHNTNLFDKIHNKFYEINNRATTKNLNNNQFLQLMNTSSKVSFQKNEIISHQI